MASPPLDMLCGVPDRRRHLAASDGKRPTLFSFLKQANVKLPIARRETSERLYAGGC